MIVEGRSKIIEESKLSFLYFSTQFHVKHARYCDFFLVCPDIRCGQISQVNVEKVQVL